MRKGAQPCGLPLYRGMMFDELLVLLALGRIDIQSGTNGEAYVSLIEGVNGGTELRIRSVTDDGVKPSVVFSTPISASRSSGFPRMAMVDNNEILIAWTEVGDVNRVRTQHITF